MNWHLRRKLFISEKAGKDLETKLNAEGPGECKFIFCDISKEDQAMVCCIHIVLFPHLIAIAHL